MTRSFSPMLIAVLCAFLAIGSACSAQEKASAPAMPAECLTLASVGRYGRSPVYQDALQAALVAGKWHAPHVDDAVAVPGQRERKWESLKADTDGNFASRTLNGGYAYFAVASPDDRVMILEASGHSMVYVNGQPRAGDPYRTGYVHLPVALHKGNSDFLFHVGRGSLRAKLSAPKSSAQFNLSDNTLPDLVIGEPVNTWGAVVVLNATNETATGLALRVGDEVQRLPHLLPLGSRKVGFPIRLPASDKEGDRPLDLKLMDLRGNQNKILDSAKVTLHVVRPEQVRKRTFISSIDGSVQYYAHVPAKVDPSETSAKPGLVLTLHGAGVEALGQAKCYASKPGLHIVAPTNRRPFGFDWEDWGRLDAMEVLNLTEKALGTDDRRTYLTGHSMGGHGTWHLGVTYPDRFAAIAPSAGWISMWSYAGARRPDQMSPLANLLSRSAMPSNTVALERNLTPLGVYILHGANDDNVPVGQARTMKQQLGGFHHDLEYHEEPGVGHWWGKAGISGAACVDWPAIFDFFQRHRIPATTDVRQVDFITASPGVSAHAHWAVIEAQERIMKPSAIHLHVDSAKRRIIGTTDNVQRLRLDLAPLRSAGPVNVVIDKQELSDIAWPTNGTSLWLERSNGRWAVAKAPDPGIKRPSRYGPFKEAFQNLIVFVYGTHGTVAENAWALAKARYDAETFWYRGNGSIDVIPDSAYPTIRGADRNVILYGNADTNSFWKECLKDSPVQVRRGQIAIGERAFQGDNLACLFIRPVPGSAKAVVGAVSGSGLAGMHLTDRLPYFLSGVGYPDCIVLGTEMLTEGLGGVRLAGFFGNDWDVKSGEFQERQK